MVVPKAVDGFGATAGDGVVDHVVVDELGVVEQLHGHGSANHILVDGAKQFRRQEDHHRPNLLSLLLKIVLHYLVHQLIGRAQSVRNQGIKLLEFGRKGLADGLKLTHVREKFSANLRKLYGKTVKYTGKS